MPHPNLKLKTPKFQRKIEREEDEREFWIFHDVNGYKFSIRKGQPLRLLAEKIGPSLWKPVVITNCWGEVQVSGKEWKKLARKLGLSPAESDEDKNCKPRAEMVETSAEANGNGVEKSGSSNETQSYGWGGLSVEREENRSEGF